jgi:pimeloyl-ACP methyl ester carboxylesterase
VSFTIPFDPSWEGLLHPERRRPFDMSSASWSDDARYAELSRLAYVRFDEADSERDRLSVAIATAGLRDLVCFHAPETNTQAFGAVAGDGRAVIAFRGTQTGWPDMRTDLAFLPKPWDRGARVHRGFVQAFESVWPRIATWLGHIGNPPVVTTGHSLGGALATLCAARVHGAELVTFGSPRVGDAAFAALFMGATARRYVGCADMVTRVPPEIGLFTHVGRLCYRDRFGRAVPDATPAMIADDRQAASRDYTTRHRFTWRNVPLRRLADHAPINYVSALLNARSTLDF